MEDDLLRFPDAPRLELERTIAELMARAQRVLTAQGRLRSLLTATRAVSEDLDLDQVLVRIVDAAIELVGARYGALGVFDEEGRLERFLHAGISTEDAERIGPLPQGRGLLGAVIETGETIRIPDIAGDPRSVGFPAHHPEMKAFLGVPIRVRDRTTGNLYLTDPENSAFSAEDQEIIEALATTAGVAIENARLYAEARRREQLRAALADVTATLLSAEGDALRVVAEGVAAVIPAELVAIITPDEDEQLRIDIALGDGAEVIEGSHYPAAGALAARAIDEGRPVTGRLPDPDEVVLRPFGHTVAVPLVTAGDAVGALCVSRRSESYTATELRTVSEFASQAGIAISLARAREQRQQMGIIEDRGRIARDLHDHVIQRLFATALGLQGFASEHPEHAATLEHHVEALDGAIADIRTAIFALRSHDASDRGLRHRVLGVVSEFTPLPRVSFSGPVDLAVAGDLADDVVAVVRESLANISRHAHATASAVSLGVTDEDVSVVVEDDGVGLPERMTRSGTANLATRAARRGGDYSLEPQPDGGTRVRWCAPLDPVAAG